MDWNLIKEKYPKASIKFEGWAKGEETFILEADQRCLYDFFDGEEIYISINFYFGEYEITIEQATDSPNCFKYKGHYIKPELFPTRTEAEEHAFLQCFEILENKLNSSN